MRLLGRGVPVLLYHAVGEEADSYLRRYCVATDAFLGQMRWLARHRYRVVDLRDLVLGVEGNHRQEKWVAVTFDDGYADVLAQAWPVLREFGYPATVFVASGMVGRANEWDGDRTRARRPLLSWEEIRHLARAGVGIGAHGAAHQRLTELSVTRAWEEIAGARQRIEDETGAGVPFFAYPYGAVNRQVAGQVAAAGYEAGFTATSGCNRTGQDRFLWRRTSILGDDPPWCFALKVRTGYATLRELAQGIRRGAYGAHPGATRHGERAAEGNLSRVGRE